jgi:hypothetical protein
MCLWPFDAPAYPVLRSPLTAARLTTFSTGAPIKQLVRLAELRQSIERDFTKI